MRTWALATLLSLAPSVAAAQEPAPSPQQQPAMPELASVDAPPVDSQHPTPGEPLYEAWWFWTGIGLVLAGVALAIVVGVVADDASDVGTTVMLRF